MRFLFLHLLVALASVAVAGSQDATPSLGDLARHERQQKQKKEAQPSKAGSPADSETNPESQPAETSPGAGQVTPTNGQRAIKPKRVITNDEIPEHVGPTSTLPQRAKAVIPDYQQPYGNGKIPADYWRQQITAQKDAIASLKANIEATNASIHFTGANCVSNCVEWNERQQLKQEQVEAMKQQLEQVQRTLEEMQEAARRQGYGSSVYDP